MHIRLFYIFVLQVIFIFSAQFAKAQNSDDSWKKITDFQQSEIGEVYDITADDNDLLWIGASSGLYSYDGFKYQKYFHHDVRALIFNHSFTKLWIGTDQDIFSLDTRSHEITKMNVEKKLVSSAEFFFHDFYEDSKDNIWVSSYNGLYQCKEDSCRNFLVEEDPLKVQNDPYLNRLTSIASHSDSDSIYIAALNGIYAFNLRTLEYDKTTLSDGIVSDISRSDDYLFYSNYKGQIHIKSKSTDLARTVNIPENAIIKRLIVEEDNSLWICTSLGLYSFDNELYPHLNIAEPLFANKKPRCNIVYKDRLGHRWAGFENGLYLFDPLRNLASVVSAQDLLDDENAQIYEVSVKNNDAILVNSNLKKAIECTTTNDKWKRVFKQFQEGVIINDTLWAVVKDAQLFGYNPHNSTYSIILDAKEFSDADFQFYLAHTYDEESNRLIIGRQWGRGVSVINLTTGEVEKFDQVDFFSEEIVTSTGFNYLAMDDEEHLYFTSGKGLGKLHLTSGKAHLITNAIKSACTGIAKDTSGIIYAAFANDGLYKVNDGIDKINVEIKDVETLFFDSQNELWTTSPSGLSNVNLYEKTFYTLNRENGLPKNNLYGAKVEAGNNRIYLYRNEWLATINKSDLTDLEVFNTKPIIESNIENRFDFSSRNYKSPGLTAYEYKLTGLHNEWQKSNPLNQVEFSNLNSGNYSFQVRSSFVRKKWKYSDEVTIHVPYPWWRKWYVIALVILVLLGLIYLYNRQIRKQEQLKSKLKSLEMKTLRSQMNPHFIFNALNSIKHFIFQNDKFEAAEYLSDFSMLIRKILVHSESDLIPLFEELETLKLYLAMEKKRFVKKFEYEINIDESVDIEMTNIPPLILQPYVENAIWHGLLHKDKAGLLRINITKKDGFYIYEIEDNGVGRAHAAQIKTKSALKKKSLGMQITRDRLHASKIKAKVEVIDLRVGTKVILKIPEL